ncbi:M50 family metallopeptidase [Hymenobacter sp. J193]|uniref:M50 family metallopeptidase n=1 Tax=Hymenobacter sp. J193 TaxID=2898429 RepID=UPI0021517702|nr:M50 family metallopeptidase [Hymenobacter sp. J193]MCR5888300.1 M50 family metallopeptidase [Hymenobacter sp. J193]
MLDFSKPDTPESSLTPEQLKQKKRRQGIFNLAFLLGPLLWLKGADWFTSISSQAEALHLPWPVLLLFWLIALVLANFLVVIIHELGHVAGALSAGFTVVSFTAGILHLERKATGWQARLQRLVAKVGGMVQVYTTHYDHLRRRYMLVVAAGPAANLLSGSLALLLLAALPESFGSTPENRLPEYLFSTLLSIFGWISIVQGVLGFVPVRTTTGYIQDSLMLSHMLRRDKAMYQQLFLLQLSGSSYQGTRPRLWNTEWVQGLLAHSSETIGENVLDCYAHSWAYIYFDDCQDLDSARRHLNEALDRKHLASAEVQQYLFCEAAYVAALRTHDVEQARHWLNRAQQVKPFTAQEGLFAQAAVLWAEGNTPQAEAFLQAAHKQLQDAIDTGSKLQSTDRMQELQSRLQQTTSATVSA